MVDQAERLVGHSSKRELIYVCHIYIYVCVSVCVIQC